MSYHEYRSEQTQYPAEQIVDVISSVLRQGKAGFMKGICSDKILGKITNCQPENLGGNMLIWFPVLEWEAHGSVITRISLAP
jgi:hypothetical protein